MVLNFIFIIYYSESKLNQAYNIKIKFEKNKIVE